MIAETIFATAAIMSAVAKIIGLALLGYYLFTRKPDYREFRAARRSGHYGLGYPTP